MESRSLQNMQEEERKEQEYREDGVAEDVEDLAAFEERANEPTLDFETFVKELKRDGTI